MRLVPLLLALALAPAAAAATGHVVDVVSNAYRDGASDTFVTRVAAGTTVTWVWLSGAHTVTEGVHGLAPVAPAFDSGVVTVDDEDPTFSVTFDAPGAYAYFCELHAAVMRGVVLVE